MSRLADGDVNISLAAGDEPFKLSAMPLSMTIPVSYSAEESRATEETELGEIELSEDLDEDGDDDFKISDFEGEA